jgi:predicted transposase YbfD/YdcC
MLDIEEYLKEIEDPRTRECPHEFRDILLIALCSSICGYLEWEEMELYAEGNKKWLRKKLKLKFRSGIPSKFTIERVISSLDAKKFELALINWSESLRIIKNGDVIAIDGKTSKGSRSGLDVLHCVNAWSRKNGITLGQVATATKSNEITAIPELIRVLDIAGTVVTIDAMGCQKVIATEIIQNKGNYFLALKGNQGIFYREVSNYLDKEFELLDSGKNIQSSFYESEIENAHGRVEQRRCLSININPDNKDFDGVHFWSDIKSICVVEAKRTIKTTGETSVTRRYYISSTTADAEKHLDYSRGHWSIENELHWVLDVQYGEDDSKVKKNGARNQATLRKIGLNLIKKFPKTKKRRSFKNCQKQALMSYEYLEGILGLQ